MRHEVSCSCGQLNLLLHGEITRTSICHCFACQKRTGSVFGVQTRLDRDKVIIKGESKQYDRLTDEGDFVHFHFCLVCGSTVYWEIDDLPDSYIVALGAFTDPKLPSPIRSVYEVSKHPWVGLPESIMEHWD